MVKTIKLYVEGGGDNNSLRTECRKAFTIFLEKAGLKGHMPRIVACGSRNDAYSSYRTAVENGESAVLLVDSEAPVIVPQNSQTYDVHNIRTWEPWWHLANRLGTDGQKADNWNKPKAVSDCDCHLMVEMMEAWFFADIDALIDYYGQKFNSSAFPKNACIEKISKDKMISALNGATCHTSKGVYSKGNHSFEILERIDPSKVMNKSPWAARFIKLLLEKMSGE